VKAARKPSKKASIGFEDRYRSALRAYAIHSNEAGLIHAYELGREAMESGKSLLEMASLHHHALLDLFNEAPSANHAMAFLRAGAGFLRESFSPYEMAHRGFQDAVKALRRMNETMEEEIKRIAHAVHDEAGQLLVAVHLALADVSRDLSKPHRDRLGHVERLLGDVEQQLRRFSHELRPVILDDLGCIAAIRLLAEGVTRRTNLPIQIKTKFAGRLPGAVELVLYRVVQEALTNTTKHARAGRVLILIRRSRGTVFCSIADDGAGFDPRIVQSNGKRPGLGLIAMKERLGAVGGTLSIDSAPGRGTRLLIRVPVQ
jgi:signal transduction histidine kinase